MTRSRRGGVENGSVEAAEAPDPTDLTEAIASVDVTQLGARIRRARRTLCLKQSDVAAGLISTAYLSRIESGQRRPDLRVLRGIAERLRTTPHELLLGLSPKEWSSVRVELDWAHLALRTGDTPGALSRTDALLGQLPPESALYRRATLIRALALEAEGRYDDAAAALEGLLDGALDGVAAIDVLTALSRIYRRSGELGRAMEVGARADQRIGSLGLRGTPEAVKLILTVAAAHSESGDVGYAARLCRKALKHADALRSADEKAISYWNASVIESRRGCHAEAVTLAQKALHILDDADSTRNTARLRTRLGALYLRVDPPRVEDALAQLRQAEPELLTSGAAPADLADNRLAQARAHFLRGHASRAATEARRVLEVVEDSPLATAETYLLLGQIALGGDDFPGAQAMLQQAILALETAGADRRAAQLWFDLGGLLLSVGCAEDALQAFQRAGVSSGLRTNAATTSTRPERPVSTEALSG
ncbi:MULTISPECIES: helix-turn-helix domain-containing protein [Nocardioides]|uniref:Helix-turn-helix domain-containing protein n=1 Tax=Nocardioides vastitatis TaxID=2568655 RepID=A0ABW0ZFU6_9ACTN|nr:helix-turn-helix domain-containing protein [Nocardioides sp.]THJ04338.1 helix-turn-helix domain-containing protein [Nocardioides sp.]